jgi:hypothetical protein
MHLHETRPCYSSGGWSPASHRGGQGSIPGRAMWALWWTKWRWDMFLLSTSVSPTNSYSAKFSILIYHRPISGRRTKWTQSQPSPRNKKKYQTTRRTFQKTVSLSFKTRWFNRIQELWEEKRDRKRFVHGTVQTGNYAIRWRRRRLVTFFPA